MPAPHLNSIKPYSGAHLLASMDLVAGPLGSVVNKLGQLLKDEYDLQTGVRKKITRLARDLESMHAALRKVGSVPPDQLNDEVKLWARDIRELSYDVDDILDSFLVRVEGHEARDPNRFKRAVKKIGKLFGKSKARHQIDSMIKTIDEQANVVAERHRRYRAEDIVSKPAAPRTIDPRLGSMYTEVTQLVGIEKPSCKLISMLSSPLEKNEVKMVSVVGAGGLGKTTLAKAVYDKLKVDFQCTAFISIGRDPDLKKVFIDILIELDKVYMDPRYRLLDGDQLIKELREYLQGKRYFIVIDDVWEILSWQRIKLALFVKNNGSRVIATTRHSDVAGQVGDVYNLEPLPCDQSEKLFYIRIFGASGKCPNNELKEVSDKILKKCDGVPLAIITMASLLVGKSGGEWMELYRSIIFRDKKNQQVSDTEWILSLSYYDLPPHLKTCSLYLSTYPEDYFIRKDPLIWKWVAEGFIHKGPGTGSLFGIGEEYFNELINRSMIQAMKSEWNGSVYGCRIHDMVLDLLRVKSREENFATIISGDDNEDTASSSNSKIQRIAHQNRRVEQTHKNTQEDLQHVRTFMAVACTSLHMLSFMSFEFLRVLALEDCNSTDGGMIHLEHIESLLHLRFLGLIGTNVSELPKGIGALKFLQTLYLEGTSVQELPSGVGMLTQLICLRAQSATIPNGIIQKLMSLEELEIYARGDMTVQFVKDLGNLCELRVPEAYVSTTGEAIFMQTDLVESLGKLHKLQHLTLRMFAVADEATWDAATLPQTLRYFDVLGVKFTVLPSCINPSGVPNLTHLSVEVRHMDEQSLKILGRLPELRHLNLRTTSMATTTIRHATNEDGCFQKLISLSVVRSTVHFALNEEDSIVSFTIWNADGDDTIPFLGSEKKPRDVRVPAPVIMPDLRCLDFTVNVRVLTGCNGSCDRLGGLEYLPSLQEVSVNFNCNDAFADDVEREEVSLRHAIQAHPNWPTLQINYFNKDEMKRCIDTSWITWIIPGGFHTL